MEWKLEPSSRDDFARVAYHPDPPVGFEVSVWFWKEDRSASGFIVISKRDSKNDYVCMNALAFRGSYKR